MDLARGVDFVYIEQQDFMIKAWKELMAFLPGVWQHRWWGLWTALIVGVGGVGLTLLMPDRYEATARVQLDTQTILKPLLSGLAVQPNTDQQVQMMARTLVSRPNVERVVEMTGLDQGLDEIKRDRLILDMLKKIQFRPSGGSNFYAVAYRDPDPAIARKVVESLLTIFQEANLGDQRRDAIKARGFIDEQLAVYEQKLVEAEAALKDFKVRNLNLMPNLASDYVAQTAEAQKELTQTRLELRQLESSREALRQQLATEPPTLSTRSSNPDGSPGAPANMSLADTRLDAARKQLDSMLVRFTDEHPDVVNMKRTIKELEELVASEHRNGGSDPERQIGSVPNKVYQDLKISLADTEARIASLRAKVAEAQVWLADARKAAQTIPQVEAEYTQLMRDYEVNKNSYDQLLRRREQAEISGSMGSDSGLGSFRVIDPPYVGQRPASPNRPLLLIGVLLASLAAGLAMTFFRDASVPTFRDPEALVEHTGLPMLGTVAFNADARTRAASRRGAFAFSASAMLYIGAFTALIAIQTFAYLKA